MDNFEWIAGYHDNFGLYHVEFNGEPAGSELPDVWPKSSVPRIANFIENPIYESYNESSLIDSFPDEFEFGVATRGIEIENNLNYGNTLWDEKDLNSPLWVPSKQTANAQALVQSDLQIIKDLGIDTYHFSITWSKLFPQGGIGEQPDSEYESYLVALLDGLMESNIKAVVTIFNYDLPARFYVGEDLHGRDKSGWLSDSVLQELKESAYIEYLIENFGNRVELGLQNSSQYRFYDLYLVHF